MSQEQELSILDADQARDGVREGYARIAEAGTLAAGTGGGCCGPTAEGQGCCDEGGWSADDLAQQIGYSKQQVESLPDGANIGLACGNPTAIGELKPGEDVLDLGSGGGFDCFLAGPRVGQAGRVIGVDMTPAMLSKARKNLAGYRESAALDNVEFRLGEIEHLPLADASVDVVISNCVLNLSPDKPQVWREIARVLRPGGRVAVSDLALHHELPEAVREMFEAMIGCVAGAVTLDVYRQAIDDAGLVDVELTPRPHYVAALEKSQDPLYHRIVEHLPEGSSVGDYVTSVDVAGREPA